jgi:hypothetical protein
MVRKDRIRILTFVTFCNSSALVISLVPPDASTNQTDPQNKVNVNC